MGKWAKFGRYLESIGQVRSDGLEAYHKAPRQVQVGAVKRALKRTLTTGATPWVIGGFVLLSVIGVLVELACDPYRPARVVLGEMRLFLMQMLWMITLVAACRFCGRRYKEAIKADLARRPCGVCGYSLIGLTENRCPECGTPFDPETYDQIIQTLAEARAGESEGPASEA